MANLITTALTYSKESATEYFFKPLFVEGDITKEITVMVDVKTSKELNEISTLSGITKAYAQGTSFTASDGVTVTQRTLTVVDVKAEVIQNGKAFKDFVGQSLLRKGWAENDINGTQFEEIVMSVFMRAIASDLQTLTWMADTNAEVTSSFVKTGVADTFMGNGVTGLWTKIIDDFGAGTIPSAQRVTMSNAAVAQVQTVTLTGTSGTCNVAIMGVNYLATFASSLTQTAADFVTTHAAALLLRDIVATSASDQIISTSAIAGVSNGTSTVSSAISGNLTGSVAATTPNTAAVALTTDEALTAFEDMRAAAPNELMENKDMLRIYATRSMVENYKESLSAVGAGEQAYTATVDGIDRLTWDGIPIIEKANWDTIISSKLGKAYPHRALMTMPEALVVGTDGSDDAMNIELWYEKQDQNNYFRVEYKLGTQYRAVDYIVAAY